MIKEGVRFNIGDELSHFTMLGLGYRRLKGQPILANIDEMSFLSWKSGS